MKHIKQELQILKPDISDCCAAKIQALHYCTLNSHAIIAQTNQMGPIDSSAMHLLHYCKCGLALLYLEVQHKDKEKKTTESSTCCNGPTI